MSCRNRVLVRGDQLDRRGDRLIGSRGTRRADKALDCADAEQ